MIPMIPKPRRRIGRPPVVRNVEYFKSKINDYMLILSEEIDDRISELDTSFEEINRIARKDINHLNLEDLTEILSDLKDIKSHLRNAEIEIKKINERQIRWVNMVIDGEENDINNN